MSSFTSPDSLPVLPLPPARAARGSVPSQLLFREVNEQLRARCGPAGSAGGELEAVCECGHRACTDRIRLPLDRYEAIRRFPTRFLMRHEHAAVGEERIVEREEGFVVAELLGPSACAAILLDPRGPRAAGPHAA